MEVEFESASQFKDILDMCSALHSDISIDFLPEEMDIKVMSDDSVALINFSAKKPFFKNYSVDKPKKISIFLDDILKILKYAKSGEGLVLRDAGDELEVVIVGKYRDVFKIPLVNGDFTPTTEPKLSFSNYIEMQVGLLSNALKKALSIDDTVGFILEKDKFTIYSKGDQKEYKLELSPANTPEIISINTEGRVESKYYGELLQKILDNLEEDSNIKLYFSSDYPLKIEQNMGNAELVYLQAQRVA